ncbi:ABC transporter ATP-binding protein [Paenibacillus larvae]|uniref:ABC transporter ATP-binding protein n=1 Tax=Paenibacillus larvae TaxID=1464 RepID=A0AAP5JSG7_9BACL|nr:ABC transporter ATP-binding protein [Paenibacillus larvae]AQR78965.1 ABC transporter ATP-binding protein [Paenibacillus larvae subsp. larvae]AVF23964.1 ABC-type multidrug transport system, ATPase component [Paenibacillus larvae subsp. larvae]ETK29364.1 bacitracin transport ATP-binding protein BcrA [Paenibacillus larvae subsp. larvae DSM 25719]MCY7476363.1 ABC transporter ATP-binding protein [Paenibacillus larvae]MCY7491413.1 ABC transporter ATP-binding protein [Paenibacillus larvae]
MMNVIEVNGLTKIYGTRTVVNKLDLEIKKGEIYGFLGRNGAGKSTFINMITGIIQPTSGSFKLLNESSLKKVYHRIGVLPDYSTFYDSLTAIDHLKYYGRITGHKLSTEQCEIVLERVGLLEHAKKKAGKYSFGMKKKLGIAQAIVHNPDLIFLDEPTSGIDAESALSIQRLIVNLQEEGKTIFMTSHNLHEVEKICTRIAIMKSGKILNEGTLNDLRAHYMSAVTVEIQHSPFSTRKDTIQQFLESLGRDIQFKGSRTSIVVESEDKIPTIIRTLTKYDIDIFRVNVDEPSLKDIFLETRQNSKIS